MKKAAGKNPKPGKTTARAAGQENTSSAAPPVNSNHAARARQRVEASRRAAVNRIVAESPD